MDSVDTLVQLKKLKKMYFFVTDVQHQLYPKTASHKLVDDEYNKLCNDRPTQPLQKLSKSTKMKKKNVCYQTVGDA